MSRLRTAIPGLRPMRSGTKRSETEGEAPAESQSAIVNGEPDASGSACTLYVDVENLGGGAVRAQKVIGQVIEDWATKCPNGDFPSPSGLALYVQADKVELWKTWANARFESILRQDFRGVQHFTKEASKNSADIAIVADAVADLATGRATHIAVISNDSDFGALFVKIREMARQANTPTVPFLWITASGSGLASDVKLFILPPFRWNVTVPMPQTSRAASPSKPTNNEAMVEHLIDKLPIGVFKAAGAQEVIKQRWPQHTAASSSGNCGKWLVDVGQLLKQRGIRAVRTTSPRTYEITKDTKDKQKTAASPAVATT